MTLSPVTPLTLSEAREALIRALELELYKLEHGLAMPRDPDAIRRCEQMLAKVRSHDHR